MIVRQDPFLQGAIDFHIHSGPDSHPRYASCLELARQAREAGLRAIVLKDQMTQSIHKAYFINKYLGGIQAFGGITLNRMVGGYDIRTVEFACRSGAKVIWLATHDSGVFFRLSRGAFKRAQQGKDGAFAAGEKDYRNHRRLRRGFTDRPHRSRRSPGGGRLLPKDRA
jgi:hypothetical protein